LIVNRGRAGVSILHWALIGVAILLVLGIIFFFSRAAFGGAREFRMMSFSFFPLGFGVFGIFWILVIFALPVFLLWPTNRRGYEDDSQQHDSALMILRERYAKGEITKEQFDQMMSELTQKSQ
jgi:putative membrane protein